MTNNLMTANEESWLSLAVVGKVQVASDIRMFTLAPVTGADDALLPQLKAIGSIADLLALDEAARAQARQTMRTICS